MQSNLNIIFLINIELLQVALTAVMTSVIMVILVFFMFLKMKKRKRLAKKINPSVLFNVDREKIDLSETKMEKLSAKGRNKYAGVLLQRAVTCDFYKVSNPTVPPRPFPELFS